MLSSHSFFTSVQAKNVEVQQAGEHAQRLALLSLEHCRKAQSAKAAISVPFSHCSKLHLTLLRMDFFTRRQLLKSNSRKVRRCLGL